MFINNKPYLRVCLALTGLIFAESSSADTTKAGINFHPTTNCELIRDIIAANNTAGTGPKIVDLGDRVFEFTQDCATTAPGCAPAINPAGCYANGIGYSHGPTALPEIRTNVKLVNGRIFRAAVGRPAPTAFRLLTVGSFTPLIGPTQFGNVSLFKVTLENGSAQPFSAGAPPVIIDSGNGGAAYVSAGTLLNLQSSKIGFNLAHDSGGGIYVAGGGTLDVQTSIISHNRADAANPLNTKPGGGGIYLARGALPAILGSLENSTLSNNTTNGGLGGGLHNQGRADLIVNSTFSYNPSQTAVPGSGESGIGFNPSGAGGAIYNDITATALEVNQSTFWGNSALLGGAIFNEEATLGPAGVDLNQNTIAHNFAQPNGGPGIYNAGIINQLVSNLIAANLDFGSKPNADMFSVVGGINSVLLPDDPPPTGELIEGFNLIGDCGAGQCQLSNDVNKDIVGGIGANGIANPVVDPRLHDLENNGGPTETVAPFPDSPAVNNGYNNETFVYDQRGANFFRTVGKTDIGSYEVQYDL